MKFFSVEYRFKEMFLKEVLIFIFILFEDIGLNIGVKRLIVFGFRIFKFLYIILIILLLIVNEIDNYLLVFIV